jgi:hypothetical protein
MNQGRVGEDRGSKETDGCPLTIGQPIEVKSTGCCIPALVVVVPWSVCPRLCNFVLHRRIQASAECQDDGDGIGITRHVDEILSGDTGSSADASEYPRERLE